MTQSVGSPSTVNSINCPYKSESVNEESNTYFPFVSLVTPLFLPAGTLAFISPSIGLIVNGRMTGGSPSFKQI